MGLDERWTLLINARDTLSSTAPNPSIFVQPSTLLISPLPLFSTAPTLSLTPKIDRVRVVAPPAGVMTFAGPLNVLYIQSSVDHISGLNPIMLQIIPRSERQCATEDTEYLTSKVLNFCNLYRLNIFCNSVQLKYVGTASYDS